MGMAHPQPPNQKKDRALPSVVMSGDRRAFRRHLEPGTDAVEPSRAVTPETKDQKISNTQTHYPVSYREHCNLFPSSVMGMEHDRTAKETPMKKLWLALFAAVPLLLVGIGTASAQIHGVGHVRGGGAGHGDGWHGGASHGGQFHDGRFFFHGRRFNGFRTNFRVFIGAPALWWGAPSYFYSYPHAYCTDPGAYYPRTCASGWLNAVPAGSLMP